MSTDVAGSKPKWLADIVFVIRDGKVDLDHPTTLAKIDEELDASTRLFCIYPCEGAELEFRVLEKRCSESVAVRSRKRKVRRGDTVRYSVYVDGWAYTVAHTPHWPVTGRLKDLAENDPTKFVQMKSGQQATTAFKF